MKKVKKLFAVLLIISMATAINTTSLAADFSDVTSQNDYSEAIYTLADMGVITGYTDGTFKPDNSVTRAEFTALITRILGLGNVADASSSPFTDVSASHWAVGNIKLAYDLGIINGFGNGIFKPDDKVTYEQCVKMIVAALGYTQLATDKGGYPTGYLAIAASNRILEKTDSIDGKTPAPRGIVAQLLYNSLEVNIAEIETDGTVITNKTLLKDRLSLTKVSGIIDGVYETALTSPVSGIKNYEVTIGGVRFDAQNFKNAQSLLGMNVSGYYKINSVDDKVLVSLNVNESKNDVVEIESAYIVGFANGTLEYFVDSKKEETENVSLASAKIIYNRKQMTYAEFVATNHIPANGSIKLIDNDGNNVYDVAVVTDYKTYVIKTISNKIIYDEFGGANITDPSTDSSVQYTIKKNGEDVAFSSLAKGDVLLVAQSENTSGKKYVEILASSNSVQGSITEKSDDEVVINGETYRISRTLINYLNTNNRSSYIAVGGRATFYLDANGVISWIKTSAEASVGYGYLITAASDSSVAAEVVQFQIYDATSKRIVTPNGASKMKVDNQSGLNAQQTLDALAASAAKTNLDGNLASNNNDPSKISSVAGTRYSQVIKYTKNDSGEVDYIDTISGETDSNTLTALNPQVYSYSGLTYVSGTKSLGNQVTINSSTKIFVVPSNRSETTKYSMKSYSSFVEGEKYKFEAFDVSSAKVAGVLVLYGSSTVERVLPSSEMMIVKSIVNTTYNDHISYKITGYSKNCAEVTYYTESESLPSQIEIGNVIRFTKNVYGEIGNIISLEVDIDNVPVNHTLTSYLVDDDPYVYLPVRVKAFTSAGRLDTKASAYYRTVYGSVYSMDEDNMQILVSSNVASAGEDASVSSTQTSLTVPSTAKFFIYDSSALRDDNKLKMVDAQVGLAEISTVVNVGRNATNVFVYTSSGTIKFVYIIK